MSAPAVDHKTLRVIDTQSISAVTRRGSGSAGAAHRTGIAAAAAAAVCAGIDVLVTEAFDAGDAPGLCSTSTRHSSAGRV
jgi:mevalonate pyrophosphate decarboxylase